MIHDEPPSLLAALREQTTANSNYRRTTAVRHADGRTQTIQLHEHVRPQYRDEYTGETLPSSWAESAIQEELDYFSSRVWVGVPIGDAIKDADAKIIGSRWVVCNKNDTHNPDVRARLVAQEVDLQGDTSCVAATPPVECKRMLLSQYATEQIRQGSP